MRHRIALAYLLIVSVVVLLSSCAGNITIHDFTACAISPGQQGAVCDQFLVNHQVILDESEWTALSTGWLAISPDDFANLKVEIEDTCNQLHCSYEQKAALQTFFRKVRALRR